MLDNNRLPVVIALGFFDSVHKGHQKVIESAILYAKENQAKTVVVTFSGNLKAVLGDENGKVVYTDAEREKIYLSLGVDEIYFAPTDFNFLSLGKLAFLNMLNRKYNVIGYSCGEDYRFGKFGKGEPKDILRFAEQKNQKVIINSILPFGKEKISTTLIKSMLAKGEISQANELLNRSYSVDGLVVHDRKMGRKLGFPTINIIPNPDKQPLLSAVYAGHVFIDGKKYKAIINYGTRPTFDLSEKLIEAHIIDYSGDLYGKEVTVYFDSMLRAVKKFENKEQLVAQLQLDKDTIRGMDV